VTTLRPVEPADIEVFYEHQADSAASEMAAFPSRDRSAHFEHWTKRLPAIHTNLAWTVLADGAVAGNVVSWLDPENGHRYFGYWLGRGFWGQGIATEAVRLALEAIHDRPIFADVAVHNIGSQRVLEKSGFQRLSDEPTTEGDGVALFSYRLD